jgi:bacillithiol biosynthesis deacetylase BshB1
MSAPFDVLAIGPHPDDVEIFCGGTVALMVRQGRRVAILDLSRGELSSRGTTAIRAAEADVAASVLGVTTRLQLGLPDGHIRADDESCTRLVRVLRELRPTVVLAPWRSERHPDHEAAAELVFRAVFMAGLRRFDASLGLEAHTVSEVLSYPMRVEAPIRMLVDISEVMDTKLAAMAAHASQLAPRPDAAPTLVGSAESGEALRARDRYFGAMAGCTFAEGFVTRSVPVIQDPVTVFSGRGTPHFYQEPK